MATTLEELGVFLKSRPPRRVPWNMGRKKGWWLLYALGTFILLFSIPFMVLFFPWHVADELALDFGTPAAAKGKVARVQKTNVTVGGGKHSRGTPVYAIHFGFETGRGKAMSGVSYRTGRSNHEGEVVDVEYLSDDPRVCRIKGCRLSTTGYLGLLVALFPLAGLGVILGMWVSRRRRVALLRDGLFTMGAVEAVEETAIIVNNERRFKVTVSYDTDSGQLATTFNAYGEDARLAQRRMEASEEMGLLYDPGRPQRVLVAGTLLG